MGVVEVTAKAKHVTKESNTKHSALPFFQVKTTYNIKEAMYVRSHRKVSHCHNNHFTMFKAFDHPPFTLPFKVELI